MATALKTCVQDAYNITIQKDNILANQKNLSRVDLPKHTGGDQFDDLELHGLIILRSLDGIAQISSKRNDKYDGRP